MKRLRFQQQSPVGAAAEVVDLSEVRERNRPSLTEVTNVYDRYLPGLCYGWSVVLDALLSRRPVQAIGMSEGHFIYGVPPLQVSVPDQDNNTVRIGCKAFGAIKVGGDGAAAAMDALTALQQERFGNVRLHPGYRHDVCRVLGRGTVGVSVMLFPRQDIILDTNYTARAPVVPESDGIEAWIDRVGPDCTIEQYDKQARKEHIIMQTVASLLQESSFLPEGQ